MSINAEEGLFEEASAVKKESHAVAPVPADKELTVAQMDRARQIAQSVDVTDRAAVMHYASEAEDRAANYADQLLANVKSGDVDEIGSKIADITRSARTLNVRDMSGTRRFLHTLPVIGQMFNRAEKFKQQFESVSTHIESICEELDNSMDGLMTRVSDLDGLYRLLVEQYHEINVFIAAGEIKLAELREHTLPALEAEARDNGLKAQEYNDCLQGLQRLEKRVHNLRISRTAVLNALPEIRLIQNGNQVLAEKIQETRIRIIPAWKRQFLLAVALDEQHRALELEENVHKTSEALTRTNAKMLKQNTTRVAESNERDLISIESIEDAHHQMIETLEATRRIQQEGSARRQDAARKIENLEQNIRGRLTVGHEALAEPEVQ